MRKRTRGKNARKRAAQLAAARAELALLLEDRMKPRFLQYSLPVTKQLIDHIRAYSTIPAWAIAQNAVDAQIDWFLAQAEAAAEAAMEKGST